MPQNVMGEEAEADTLKNTGIITSRLAIRAVVRETALEILIGLELTHEGPRIPSLGFTSGQHEAIR